MRLTQNLTLRELAGSSTAELLCLDNRPSERAGKLRNGSWGWNKLSDSGAFAVPAAEEQEAVRRPRSQALVWSSA